MGLFDRVGREDSREDSRRLSSASLKKLEKKLDIRSGEFQWPLRSVVVTSGFGKRPRDYHEGLDLRAALHTAVFASQSGTVLYADDRVKGYGKMVVIRHRDQLATVYAHNSQLLVRRGEKVSQGQQVAWSGSTGHSTGPHLHFEVRHGLAAINPIAILPRWSWRRAEKLRRKGSQMTAFLD
jgi:murein DD-endopeptidase MepM/ murein hydrolase activator NlpD